MPVLLQGGRFTGNIEPRRASAPSPERVSRGHRHHARCSLASVRTPGPTDASPTSPSSSLPQRSASALTTDAPGPGVRAARGNGLASTPPSTICAPESCPRIRATPHPALQGGAGASNAAPMCVSRETTPSPLLDVGGSIQTTARSTAHVDRWIRHARVIVDSPDKRGSARGHSRPGPVVDASDVSHETSLPVPSKDRDTDRSHPSRRHGHQLRTRTHITRPRHPQPISTADIHRCSPQSESTAAPSVEAPGALSATRARCHFLRKWRAMNILCLAEHEASHEDTFSGSWLCSSIQVSRIPGPQSHPLDAIRP